MELQEFEFEEKTALCARADQIQKDGGVILGVGFARERWHLFFRPACVAHEPPLGEYKLSMGKFRGCSLDELFDEGEAGIAYLVWIRDESKKFDETDKSVVTRYLNERGGYEAEKTDSRNRGKKA